MVEIKNRKENNFEVKKIFWLLYDKKIGSSSTKQRNIFLASDSRLPGADLRLPGADSRLPGAWYLSIRTQRLII